MRCMPYLEDALFFVAAFVVFVGGIIGRGSRQSRLDLLKTLLLALAPKAKKAP